MSEICTMQISHPLKKNLLAFIYLLTFQTCFGWGGTGHRAVGLIAERNLLPEVKIKLEKILGGESVAMVGTWMDDVRSDSLYADMAAWHWVTIETGQTYESSPKNPKGDAIMTIERLIAALKSKKLSAKQETEYVKMLVHLIADIHMPLHVGCCDDSGGAKVRIKWFGVDTNLHRVWDYEMIDETRLSYTELADAVGKPSKETILKLQKSDVHDWVKESMALRSQAYSIGDGSLGYKYTYKNFGTVKRRILEAGIRLAGVLNGIYQ